MKRNIIILVALIVLCAMPVLASTPEQENAPLVNEDEMFLGEMNQLNEEDLIAIIGNNDYHDAGGGSGYPWGGGGTTSEPIISKLLELIAKAITNLTKPKPDNTNTNTSQTYNVGTGNVP